MDPYDVIVIGGSFAGLAAATQLARARRSILVIDDGQPRNRFAKHSHGFLGQDGVPPSEILAVAHGQLAAYPTVDFLRGRAASATQSEAGLFEVETPEGHRAARRLILAYGVRDVLPEIEGLRELWGTDVFHCPYCHGYELRDRPLAILSNGEAAVHQAIMLPDWSPDVMLFTNGPATFDETARARIARRGVPLDETPVARVVAEGGSLRSIVLADGREVSRAAILTATRVEPSSDLAVRLGCDQEDTPLGTMLRTDARKETTVAGVYAAGDLAHVPHSVSFAVADGVMAGVMAHQSLLAEDWA
jgi:thioredoxin reductase